MTEHDNDHCNSSSFLSGLIFGAILAGVAAIIIYRRDKGKTFDKIQKELTKYIQRLTASNSDK